MTVAIQLHLPCGSQRKYLQRRGAGDLLGTSCSMCRSRLTQRMYVCTKYGWHYSIGDVTTVSTQPHWCSCAARRRKVVVAARVLALAPA